MINRYDDMKKTVDMYMKEEAELKKRAKYIVYILDWDVKDMPDCPTDIVKIYYAETIDEAFLDMAFANGYFGYPVCICDVNFYLPDSFFMQDVLSAYTVKNFEKALAEHERQQQMSLEERLKEEAKVAQEEAAKQQEETKKKGQRIALLILS